MNIISNATQTAATIGTIMGTHGFTIAPTPEAAADIAEIITGDEETDDYVIVTLPNGFAVADIDAYDPRFPFDNFFI